jgi:hypothetical protein
MNCSEFDEVVHELDRPGGANLASGERADSELDGALAHAESCSRCAKLLTEVEGLNFALRAIANRDADERAPARLEATLIQAFRSRADSRQSAVAGKWMIAARLGAYRWYAAAAGAVAVLLLALGLIRGWWGTMPTEPVGNTTAVTETGETSASAKTPLQAAKPAVTSTSQQANASQAPAAEDTAAFYALPYADAAASLDGGAVIRVSVPRSALVAWGLPVSGMGGTGPVPADLVVSADGTPQAIRLVAETDE